MSCGDVKFASETVSLSLVVVCVADFGLMRYLDGLSTSVSPDLVRRFLAGFGSEPVRTASSSSTR